jgi:hypothetical protein
MCFACFSHDFNLYTYSPQGEWNKKHNWHLIQGLSIAYDFKRKYCIRIYSKRKSQNPPTYSSYYFYFDNWLS